MEEQKRRRGRPPRSYQPIPLDKVRYLAKLKCTQREIARSIGMSEDHFGVRLKQDPELQAIMDSGEVTGNVEKRQLVEVAMRDRFFTFCMNPDCKEITEDPMKWFGKCPACNSLDGEGKPTTVKHERIAGDHGLLETYADTYLGWSDTVTIQGNEEKPVVIATLAEAALARAKRKREQKAKERAEAEKVEVRAPEE